MAAEHKSHRKILEESNSAIAKIPVGGIYTHYKNRKNKYTVKGFGTLESSDELCVIYQAAQGDKSIFIRPVDSWLGEVEWQRRTVPRFTKIDSKNT